MRIGALLSAFVLTGTGVANAVGAQVSPTTETMSFGLLGPVGLAAVVLGVVGMTLGVIRQRRKAAEVEAEPVTEAPEDVRPPLTPYRRPSL
ncbi:hypothetical protein GKO32_20430 [Amycolatopsis sp. RM579]|uniref:LPXTG cell wall anchor domain-containing protein n=1 Tax=Amycolatopsis pithecellobii TaxID=664692 RepID=A0A6N7YTG9_9PSEU|nr:hypothetical protein [Amycolatopsis pithecellobii]